MAFIITGAYGLALFAAAMFFIRKRRGVEGHATPVPGAKDKATSNSGDRFSRYATK